MGSSSLIVSEAKAPISSQDSYCTDSHRRRPVLARVFLSPLWTFYPQVFWIVWTNSRKAVRGRYGDREWALSSLDIVTVLENVGIRLEISGLDNLRHLDGPAVIIGNHMSTLETFILPGIVRPLLPVTFVVKQSLITMPVFGPIMRNRDPIVVGRVNPREDLRTVLEEGMKRLAAGISVIIFPQSTRTPHFDPEQFNTLGIKLAAKAGVPALPLALKTDAWGTGKIVKDFGPIDRSKTVHFAFGRPMCIEGRGAEEHRQVISFIQEHLEQWSNEEKR